MIIPGVQKPHCRPWHSLNAACMGCSVPSACASPSMVVTSAPCICATSTLQDLMAWPLAITVQAPHCAVSQPRCVPVRCRWSRMNPDSKVLGATSALTLLPFTFSSTCMVSVS